MYHVGRQTSIGFRRIRLPGQRFFRMPPIHDRSSGIMGEIIINTILSFEKTVELEKGVWYNCFNFSRKEGMYHV